MEARLRFAVLRAVVVGCGMVLSAWTGAGRVHAQQSLSFGDAPANDLLVPAFTDLDLAGILKTLDSKLAVSQPTPDRWKDAARTTLSEFTKRLQAGRLSPGQEAVALDHLTGLAQRYVSDAGDFDSSAHVIKTLTVGKHAPEIAGKDLDGRDLKLSGYRGKVVVLTFNGEWCGICRSQYPYERLLLELYKNWPFALLAVNSDADPAVAKKAYESAGLVVPTWFDHDPVHGPRGPIASAWNVTGWPAIYVLDADGVIRFIDVRQEDLLKGVRQLLTAQQQAQPTRR